MYDIILSIKPEFAEKIYSGQKWAEIRTLNFQYLSDGDKVYLYETKPVQKITGFFTLKGKRSHFKNQIWDRINDGTGLTKEEYDSFMWNVSDRKAIWAYIIEKSYKFKYPIDPDGKFVTWKAPQSFVYTKEFPINRRVCKLCSINNRELIGKGVAWKIIDEDD